MAILHNPLLVFYPIVQSMVADSLSLQFQGLGKLAPQADRQTKVIVPNLISKMQVVQQIDAFVPFLMGYPHQLVEVINPLNADILRFARLRVGRLPLAPRSQQTNGL